ncbi:CGNR zinc finger domain-containing protein [Pseudonocardia sp. CA-107938]|uniref:CGNR zinc finger domain-containing protein n=1 Tax=Pseudonocardia sp. CA-107938 TaxID=3240021 RepID=UPI003D8A6742
MLRRADPTSPIATAVQTIRTGRSSRAPDLTGPGAVRLRADDTCGRLFVDRSRNRSRRRCSSADCGNRARARRHR